MLSTQGRAAATTALFLAAIVIGGLLGHVSPAAATAASASIDPVLLVLVSSLFLTLRLDAVAPLRRARRVVLLAIGINFLAIPLIALALTALLPNEAMRLGVLIYCLAPCTDWFLGFTRLAGGDTFVGAALIPLQMSIQLLLYPVWLAVFSGAQLGSVPSSAGSMLLTWFVLPAAVGLGARLAMRLALPEAWRRRVLDGVDRATPFVIAALILAIFASNVETLVAEAGSVLWVLLVVFAFFVLTYLLGEVASRRMRLEHSEHALLTMTTSARNAPLMLALTTIALPEQPLVHAALVLGMLIEFPHLTAITHLLRRSLPAAGAVADSRPVSV